MRASTFTFCFLVLTNFCMAQQNMFGGQHVALWVYQDAIGADVFLNSQRIQMAQIELVYGHPVIKEWINAENKREEKNQSAIMLKSWGCGGHASSKANLCEFVFTKYSLFDSTAADKVHARVFATVNLQTKVVSNIQFETRF